MLDVYSYLYVCTRKKSGKLRVYCELSGKPDNLSFEFGKEPIPQFDFSMKKAYPKDKSGKKIKFDTNIDAINWAVSKGWSLVESIGYRGDDKTRVYIWLYKDVSSVEELMEGFALEK